MQLPSHTIFENWHEVLVHIKRFNQEIPKEYLPKWDWYAKKRLSGIIKNSYRIDTDAICIINSHSIVISRQKVLIQNILQIIFDTAVNINKTLLWGLYKQNKHICNYADYVTII